MTPKEFPQTITMIGSLPPIIGVSPYTKGLVIALSQKINIHFLGFHHIYPSFLYPGKMRDENAVPLKGHEKLNIQNTLDWFNPFGWIIEAFKINTTIIHAQWWSFPLAPIYITILGINKLRGKKIILTIHNVAPHEKNFFKNILNKSVFYLGDQFIVHTEKNKEQLSQIIKGRPIHIVPHGIIQTDEPKITREEARKKLKIDAQDKVLLCFGHIRSYKGLDTAIEALGKINDPAIKLLVAGKCWEDWAPYQTLIQKHNLNRRVILHLDLIPENEIEVFYRASDLVLLPYKYFDAQSGVGALSLHFCIPMIVSRTGGLPEYASYDECITTPDDPIDLAEKIKYILANPAFYHVLKEDVVEKASCLDWNYIADKVNLIYQDMAAPSISQGHKNF